VADVVEYFLYESLGDWGTARPKDAERYKGTWRKRYRKSVVWITEEAAFKPFGFHSYACKARDVGVIGNTYQLPELLEAVK